MGNVPELPITKRMIFSLTNLHNATSLTSMLTEKKREKDESNLEIARRKGQIQ